MTPARIAAYVDELRQAGSSSATLAHRIVGLHLALCALAPGHDWVWLGRLAARLRRQVRSTRAKHLLVRSSCEPAAAGVAMMAEAEAAIGQRPAVRATIYRDGLMLALLAACPVRAGNFAAIRIGHHLRRVGAGWWLTFEPGETKAGTAIELPLPNDLVGRLEAYLERWRPVLLGGGDSDCLWISGRGRPLSYDTVYYRIRVATRRRLGRAMNPHLLRDCLATSIAIDDPAKHRHGGGYPRARDARHHPEIL